MSLIISKRDNLFIAQSMDMCVPLPYACACVRVCVSACMYVLGTCVFLFVSLLIAVNEMSVRLCACG